MNTVKFHLVPALLALALLFALTAGCNRKPASEPPAPPSLKPVTAEPGETPSAALLKKEDALHVKVKREKDGEYTWEITGKDVRAITDADKALRRGFEPKEKPAGTD